MKQFEADSNANVVVALDVSKSMRYGSGLSKLDYGRFLAASLLYFSSKQRDRVGLVTFDREVIEYVPASAKHLDFALFALDRVGEARAGSLAGPLLTYRTLRTESQATKNHLVMGPWTHGSWSRGEGRTVGNLDFGQEVSTWYREHVEFPFFMQHLKDKTLSPWPWRS